MEGECCNSTATASHRDNIISNVSQCSFRGYKTGYRILGVRMENEGSDIWVTDPAAVQLDAKILISLPCRE